MVALAPAFTPVKIFVPIEAGALPIKFTFAKLAQFRNAELSMFVTLLPMVTLVRAVQFQNTPLSIVVTLPGMVMLFRDVQL